MNIQLYFLRVRNVWKQIFEFFERRWKRNLLWTFLLATFFVLGMWVSAAWASEAPSGRASDREPTQVLSATSRLQRERSDWVSATSTTTTTLPVIRKSRSTETKSAVKLQVTQEANYPPESIEAMIAEVFPENPQLWIAIARCESGLRSNAHNPSGASGIFQMMMPMHSKLVNGDPFDPATNIRAARSLSRNGTSTGPWDASKGCWS